LDPSYVHFILKVARYSHRDVFIWRKVTVNIISKGVMQESKTAHSGGIEWRRWDLNPQPRDYDALALPLSYLAKRARYYYGVTFLSTRTLNFI
jgi:hypothetical protein